MNPNETASICVESKLNSSVKLILDVDGHSECKFNSSQGDILRHNRVSTVRLNGVDIICLWIDNQERLCLAQISNTLLKEFSYNEIHNRRVALGITCIQCTPAQLEILRRTGAMPISSRRCGMITKREAERLVKSFLEEAAPPNLDTNFRFEVKHECGFGCRGYFIPSRYNSSRAKCVQCYYCSLFYSPNKFIFHFHRFPNSKYKHPDAANFNSWRRHLLLVSSTKDNELLHAWEDVKAMFNGGNRRRILTAALSRSSKDPYKTQAPQFTVARKVLPTSSAVKLENTLKPADNALPHVFKPLSFRASPYSTTALWYPWRNFNSNEQLRFRTEYHASSHNNFAFSENLLSVLPVSSVAPADGLIESNACGRDLLHLHFKHCHGNCGTEEEKATCKPPNTPIFRPYALDNVTKKK